jgi:outer membrane lipoprotein-sorting protein
MKRVFEKAELGIRADADERVLNDVLEAHQQNQAQRTSTRRAGRITMRSPIAKLAVAAIVAVACIVGLFMWTGTQSGVALADVLSRIQQVNVYMYQMTMTTSTTLTDDKQLEQETKATVLMSQDLGMKVTRETDVGISLPGRSGTTVHEMYLLPQQGRTVTLMPALKRYMEIEFDDAEFQEKKKESHDPRVMVEQILQCAYTSLGRSTIDGVEVEGFRTTDPNYLAGMVGHVDVKIWVDVKTQLPVRSEMDMQMGGEMDMHMVIHDFQWDVLVDASEFEPAIPDDYTTMAGGPIKMPEINEETAIKGLKLYADRIGAYPEKLDFMTAASLTKDAGFAKSLNDEQPDADKENLTPDERIRNAEKRIRKIREGLDETFNENLKKMVDVMMPIQGTVMFYVTLTQEDRDPAYYGNIVTPADADRILMRWKVSDTEYRVIFGSLHVETVTADVLAELEAALPM